MTQPKRKNIRYPLAVDISLHRLAEHNDHGRHVDEMIRQVLFTNPGERINRPDFGCGVRRMVFAPNSDVTASLTQVTVLQALEAWLSDVIVVDEVATNAEQETLTIQIAYRLRSTGEQRYLNVEVAI